MTPLNFVPEPYRPPKWLTNSHVQTLTAFYTRRPKDIELHRQRLHTPDGDFLNLDFPIVAGQNWQTLGETTPIVLVLHGLEGSAKSGYCYETYRELSQRGIRAVGLNFRSCGGEMNLTSRIYHAGETEDLTFVVQWLAQHHPHVPIGVVGFSLGGNILLKYLGETPHTAVRSAVAVSPPFDLTIGERVLTGPAQRMYLRSFMKSLIRKLEIKQPVLQDKIDVPHALQAKTLGQFDARVTVPLNGYPNVAEYYAANGSGRYLAHIHIPTLIIRALDDPFYAATEIPYETITANPYLQLAATLHGGHLAFIEERDGRYSWWAERQSAHFLASYLI